MQNEGVALGDLFESFPQEIPQFFILNSAFRASARETAICILSVKNGSEQIAPICGY
jgi:hypothetical protein